MNTVAVAYLAKGPYELTRAFLRTPGPRCRRSMQCLLEGLEIRTAPAGSAMAMVSGGVASAASHGADVRANPTPQGRDSGDWHWEDGGAAGRLGHAQSLGLYTGAAPVSLRGREHPVLFGRRGRWGQTIAIVDAYDDPDLIDTGPGFSSSDLAEFDQKFGLPDPPSFIKVNEYGSTTNLPGVDPAGAGNPQGNWEVEEALDVEWRMRWHRERTSFSSNAIPAAAPTCFKESSPPPGSPAYR